MQVNADVIGVRFQVICLPDAVMHRPNIIMVFYCKALFMKAGTIFAAADSQPQLPWETYTRPYLRPAALGLYQLPLAGKTQRTLYCAHSWPQENILWIT